MPKLTIVRGPSAVSVRRGDVPTFATFAVKNRDGRLGTEYAHVGHNGRSYAVNLDSKELASSNNRTKMVTLTGKWEPEITRLPVHQQIRMTRNQVRPGDVFVQTGAGSSTEYMAFGSVERDRQGWLSVPVSRPHNHAIAENADSRVTVIGSFKMRVTSSK